MCLKNHDTSSEGAVKVQMHAEDRCLLESSECENLESVSFSDKKGNKIAEACVWSGNRAFTSKFTFRGNSKFNKQW